MSLFLLTGLFIFIFLIFIFTIIFIGFLIFALPVFFGAPFVPVSSEEINKILKLAEPKPGEILYDLGSGDGRIIIEAVKNYNVRAIGIEINPFLFYFSRWKIKKLGLQAKVKVLQGNFFKKDISQANIIIIYLLQRTNYRLEKKFLSDLRPGTRIISKSFIFKKLPLVKSNFEGSNIRLYQIPENKNERIN